MTICEMPAAVLLTREEYKLIRRGCRKELWFEERWPDGRPVGRRIAKRHRVRDYGMLWRAWTAMPDAGLKDMMKKRGWENV